MEKSKPISEEQSSIILGPNAIKEAIAIAIEVRRPVMIWGPPGIGKSEIIQLIGKETSRKVIDIRLALWEPTDIRGIPYFDSESKEMRWSPPSEFPKLVGDNSIIFYDELVSAVPSVQAAAYQLIHNRRVGEYQLPEGVDQVAAGNRENDRGVTHRMPTPLLNRFLHLEMKHSFPDWLDWAIKNDIDKSVVSFLSWSKKDLFNFDPKSSSKAFATPRSWSFVNDLLKSKKAQSSESLLTSLVAGCVGEGLAISFMSHRRLTIKLPKTEDILSGKLKKFKVGKDVSLLYSLTINCCHALKESIGSKDWLSQVDNFFEFMMDNFPEEITVMGVRTAMGNYKLPINPEKLSVYKKFSEKIEKFIFVQD
jgi:MoxR-like ATPase